MGEQIGGLLGGCTDQRMGDGRAGSKDRRMHRLFGGFEGGWVDVYVGFLMDSRKV